MLVQRRRDLRAATKLMRNLLGKPGLCVQNARRG